ncbi:MAG: DUF115 domain-containing protein [Ruminococcus flavefaciens]|nr:DUF115 domain-containing protein [Ruminococcus flavefaciens]
MDDLEKLYMQMRRIENIYKDKVLFAKMDSKEKNILKQNRKYKDSYKNKKCFIVGNGPSVNQIDFSSLEKELVITVNEMFRHKDFDKLHSNFHFIADPAYLKLNKRKQEEGRIIEKMQQLSKNNTILFFPIEGLNIARHYGWQDKLKIRYFSSKLFFYDGYKEPIDFTRYIPGFQAVIQWAIAFAAYMGCNEIYLLGCDATNIVTDISLFLKKDTDLTYAYDLSEEDAEIVRKKHRSNGLEYTLYGYWKIVHLFSELYLYCKKNGIRLYNCSEESILNCIPKKNFKSIGI